MAEQDALDVATRRTSRLAALAEQLGADKLDALLEHPQSDQLFAAIAGMDERALGRLLQPREAGRREPPPIEGDFLHLFDDLPEEVRAVRDRVREFMEARVAPIADEYWERAEFPHHLIPEFAPLGLIEAIYPDGDTHHAVMEGIITQEMARVDPSMATFLGVHAGLAYGSIFLCGSAEQKAEWLPRMRSWETIGAFGLTEPDVGSGVSGGLATTARRDGDAWVLDGQKKWIGNSTFGHVIVVWARDVEDGQVKGYLVRPDAPGVSVEKMEGKIAQRTLQNGLVTLDGVRVAERDRLQRADSFRDVGRVLAMTRVGVAWIAVGCALGAYEKALAYAQEREQFGKTLGSFQLIQMMLVQMLGDLVSMQGVALRVSQLQDAGTMREEHASLAKMFCSAKCRRVVALARELMGGNGILLEHGVARHFADAEAIYSYEGSNEINALIIGRALTGVGAFV